MITPATPTINQASGPTESTTSTNTSLSSVCLILWNKLCVVFASRKPTFTAKIFGPSATKSGRHYGVMCVLLTPPRPPRPPRPQNPPNPKTPLPQDPPTPSTRPLRWRSVLVDAGVDETRWPSLQRTSVLKCAKYRKLSVVGANWIQHSQKRQSTKTSLSLRDTTLPAFQKLAASGVSKKKDTFTFVDMFIPSFLVLLSMFSKEYCSYRLGKFRFWMSFKHEASVQGRTLGDWVIYLFFCECCMLTNYTWCLAFRKADKEGKNSFPFDTIAVFNCLRSLCPRFTRSLSASYLWWISYIRLHVEPVSFTKLHSQIPCNIRQIFLPIFSRLNSNVNLVVTRKEMHSLATCQEPVFLLFWSLSAMLSWSANFSEDKDIEPLLWDAWPASWFYKKKIQHKKLMDISSRPNPAISSMVLARKNPGHSDHPHSLFVAHVWALICSGGVQESRVSPAESVADCV